MNFSTSSTSNNFSSCNNFSLVQNSDQQGGPFFQIICKVNGHIQKIRKRNISKIVQEAASQIQGFIQQFQGHEVPDKNLTITIRPISHSNKQVKVQRQMGFQPSILKEQIKLFSSDQDILSFIETQKNLSHNIENELSDLLFSCLSLCHQHIQNESQNLSPLEKLIGLSQKSGIHSFLEGKQKSFIKQKLEELEDKCLQALQSIKEERRKIDSCCICLYKKSNILIFPCMHICTCTHCAYKVQKCPLCKKSIQERRSIFQ